MESMGLPEPGAGFQAAFARRSDRHLETLRTFGRGAVVWDLLRPGAQGGQDSGALASGRCGTDSGKARDETGPAPVVNRGTRPLRSRPHRPAGEWNTIKEQRDG